MKKEILEKELLKVLTEAKVLEEKSEMVFSTANFLRIETDKLIEKMEDDNIPYDEKEEIGKQLIALHKKIECEIRSLENDIPQTTALDDRMNKLKLIFETNLEE